MKERLKQLIIFLIIVLYAFSTNVSAEPASGSCGPNATWILEDNGTLTISGTGRINSYSWDKTSVKKVIIEEGITDIYSPVFLDCSMLSSVSLPESLTGIAGYTFGNCTSLKSITIPDGVTIDAFAFSGCTNMESIYLADNIETDSKAFNNCSGRRYTKIGSNTALSLCRYNINAVFYDPDYPGLGFSQSDQTSLYIKAANTTAYYFIIPEGVTGIGNEVFSHCSNLTGIVIPEGVEYIGESAFRCTKANCFIPECNVKRVVFPRSIKGIGLNAFNYHTLFYCYNGTYPYELAYYGNNYEYVLLDGGTDVIEPTLDIPEHMDILLGRNTLLGASVFPYNQNTTVTYSSANEGIATISAKGVISPVSVGETEITVCANGIEKTTGISVMNRAESFTIPEDIYVKAGESIQLTINDLTPENALTDLSWRLAYYKDASLVEATGVLTGKNVGQTTLTVQDLNSGLWCMANVYIVPPVSAISFTRNRITTKARSTEQLQALVEMGDLSVFNKMIVFESSNPSIATVDANGLVTGIKPGSVIITASADGVSDTCEIIFEPNTLTLPEDVTEIGEEAFANLQDVDYIVLPAGITNINDTAFSNSPISLVVDEGSYSEQWAEGHQISYMLK